MRARTRVQCTRPIVEWRIDEGALRRGHQRLAHRHHGLKRINLKCRVMGCASPLHAHAAHAPTQQQQYKHHQQQQSRRAGTATCTATEQRAHQETRTRRRRRDRLLVQKPRAPGAPRSHLGGVHRDGAHRLKRVHFHTGETGDLGLQVLLRERRQGVAFEEVHQALVYVRTPQFARRMRPDSCCVRCLRARWCSSENRCTTSTQPKQRRGTCLRSTKYGG